jgi:hypothetical protein
MNDRVVSILGADAGSQQQFLDTFQRSDFLTPEKSLLSAILEDAIHIYRKYQHAKDRGGRERYREAQAWIRHHGNDWIFDFDSVCDLLGFNPDFIRRSLSQTKPPPAVHDHPGRRQPRHRRAA